MTAWKFTDADSLRGARVASFGDHRIAMAFAVAGLFADGETIVQDAQCVHESYPDFAKALEEIVNPKRMRITTPVISSLSPKADEMTCAPSAPDG